MDLLKSSGTCFRLLCACLPLLYGTAHATDFYAAPDGFAGGDGTIERPWNLGSALKGVAAVRPGDTIWLRGGVYRAYDVPSKYFSALEGAENLPITVRQFPGERAIVDGSITQLTGGWVNYWGFEIMNTLPARITDETGPFPTAFKSPDGRGNNVDLTVSGFDLRAPNVKLINMIIHDSIGGGIVVNSAAINPEIYGTFSFHNGWQGADRGHGHGFYGQNVSPSVALVRDNLFFSNFALGAQVTGTGPVVDNFRFEGNVFFFNSALSRKHQGNLVVGPFSGQARNIEVLRNFFFETDASDTDVNLGYVGGIINGAIQGNYFATKVVLSPHNENVRVVKNTFVNANAPGPRTNKIVVRPNIYEPGRAHIIVYNWEALPQVTVDLSDVLPVGTVYEIRTAQDILGVPIIQGVFAGGSVLLPMTGLPVAKSFLGRATAPTAPLFNVFVLIPQIGGTSLNQAPVMSGIPDQVTTVNTTTPAIRFTIGDPELRAAFLNVSVASSNPALIPNENIRFSGTGLVRYLTLRPNRDQTGSAAISVFVSDGLRSTNTTFTVTVNPGVAASP